MDQAEESLTAPSLLLAHPSLHDPHFERSVILLSVVAPGEGTIGLILNRPIGKTLAHCGEEFLFSRIGEVPVFLGGPVQTEQVMLAAFRWGSSGGDDEFEFRMGLSVEEATDLLDACPDAEVRGYLGYAGWAAGQLEAEIRQHAWVSLLMNPALLKKTPVEDLWNTYIRTLNPGAVGLLDFPRDPSVN